jgi:class 3 adenylate cyclase/alpha-beta hydrolase superfamily lysophospholipase
VTDVPETRYARTPGGLSIAYWVVGDGPTDLLWLTGFMGNLEVMWEQPLVASFFSRLAASGYRVIYHDHRATGLSDRTTSLPDLETQVDDIRTVLDAATSWSTVVAGNGWGIAPAALFASTFPDRVRSLVLHAASGRMARAPDYPWGIDEDEYLRDFRMAEEAWGTKAYAAYVLSSVAPSMVNDRAFVDWYAKMMRHWATPSSAAALTRQYYELDVRSVLPTIRVPTLVLSRHWKDPEEDDYVAGLISGAKHLRLPGGDWMPFTGDQDAVIDAIRTFLGPEPVRSTDERSTLLQAILFTDIVDSTELISRLGDRAWKDLLERHHALVRQQLARFRGVEVDTAGDGFYANFDGPARAVRCAVAIATEVTSLDIRIRAGVHAGECEVIDGKCGGLAVSLGARVASMAGPGEVLVSQTVKDLVAGSGLTFEDAGEHELKGVPDRWRLYRLVT